MADNQKNINDGSLHKLFMQCKYQGAVKKLTRGITHDYNNIFTGLSGQMRRWGGDNADKRSRLVEELLQRGIEQTALLSEFSRDAEDGKNFHSVRRLANKAIDLLNAISRVHQFELHLEDNLPRIHSRYREIILMLFYLGENALEAMESGGLIRVDASLIIKANGTSCIRFYITDSGVGIDDQWHKYIPDPLSTIAFEPMQEGCTLSLGLYAVQSIVNDHQGELSITRVPAGGTSVTVDLPVDSNADETTEMEEESHYGPGLKERNEKRVFLVVDDEEAIREFFLARLQKRGHVVFCTDSCNEAVEDLTLLNGVVNVALVDIGLPDATGYECARKLRRINENILVILMSGMELDRSENLDTGVEFMKKPFSLEQLEKLVNDAKL